MSELIPSVFNASFSEFLNQYRDVTYVYISDGTDGNPIGTLCATYAGGTTQAIGYVDLYNIAHERGYTGTAENWVDAIVSLAAMDKGAETTISYQNSTSGTVHPTGDVGWTSSPNPQKGEYLWTRVKLKWKKREQEDVIYIVSYQGKDATAPVSSVNGFTGAVTLHGSNIPISSGDAQTIKAYIDNLTPTVATNAEIDALFGIEPES